MGLFKGKKVYFNSYNNQYYKGTNCFVYSQGDSKISLNVIRKALSINSSDIYKCILHFSDEIYNNVVAGLDLEEMRNNSRYAKFVFEHIFNKENIKNLNKSYYLGSAFVQNDRFIFIRDEEIYKEYYDPEYRKELALFMDSNGNEVQLESTNKSAYVKVKKR